MATEKTVIIERIFNARWDANSGQVTNTVVTFQDIQEAIRMRNLEKPEKPLSPANPANFFKDFTRRRQGANANWPSSVLQRGYTARQLTRGGQCFEFIRKTADQTEAFPVSVPMPSAETPTHRVTSAVLPVASREFGRADEPWLLQIIVRLRIVETHMTLFSPRRDLIVHVDHLQNSVKLHGSEIDAVFLGVEKPRGSSDTHEFLITCEAKQQHEDFSLDQLLRQPLAAFKTKSVKQNVIVPVGIRAIGPSRIHLIEFAAVQRDEADSIDLLTRASDAIYQLEPPVPGIGK